MMSEAKQETSGRGFDSERFDLVLRWVVLVLGLVVAGACGASKFSEVSKAPELFEYVFFSGATFIAMICGLVLVIMSIGYPLFFGPDTDMD